jgi:hypothetical protein
MSDPVTPSPPRLVPPGSTALGELAHAINGALTLMSLIGSAIRQTRYLVAAGR